LLPELLRHKKTNPLLQSMSPPGHGRVQPAVGDPALAGGLD